MIKGKHDHKKKFYEQFGKCLNMGVYEDSTNRTKIAELMRYHISKSGDEQISLKHCVDQMKEVLYMLDRIDEYAVQQLKRIRWRKAQVYNKGRP